MIIESGKELAYTSSAEKAFREGETALDKLSKRTIGCSWFLIGHSWVMGIQEGDKVLVDNSGLFTGDGIYAFHFNGEPHVAHILPVGKPGLLQLWVEEKRGDDGRPFPFSGQRFITVESCDVDIVGKVVCTCRIF